MDPEIWGNLPIELVRKIIGRARGGLSIDTRMALGFRPRKMPEAPAWKLWYLLNNDGLFYILDTKTLHNFRVPGAHIIRRPVDIAWLDMDLAAFNLNREEHSLEITLSSGSYVYSPRQTETFMTDRRVILKGAPAVNAFHGVWH
jgi:hypothetical protein